METAVQKKRRVVLVLTTAMAVVLHPTAVRRNEVIFLEQKTTFACSLLQCLSYLLPDWIRLPEFECNLRCVGARQVSIPALDAPVAAVPRPLATPDNASPGRLALPLFQRQCQPS